MVLAPQTPCRRGGVTSPRPDRHNGSVASTTVDAAHPQSPVRPNLTSVGTIVWLSSELMFFAALFAIYFTLRSNEEELWAERSELLNIPFSLTITTILVLSSVTCQLGVLRAERGQVGRTGSLLQVGQWGMREWFVLTFVMGALFISGQAYEYAELVMHEGLTLSSDPYGSIFYLATGFHGLHVTLGLLAFLLVLGRTFMTQRFTHQQATSAIVVSYYWHFVDVVWIALYLTIYIAQ
ncbi:heme-copper oxidase subunit III [Phytoactinopolyspora halotolerans]|uniref:cytochrome-c oxidase n=1 Tax=Phytoactinopolyspora halotolerans TaxID=1981512 RepID=A0A6L9SB99_9ACTN|nr:heme-copper oxidase subunit III [Phytoactinopolyspora halotolerans]